MLTDITTCSRRKIVGPIWIEAVSGRQDMPASRLGRLISKGRRAAAVWYGERLRAKRIARSGAPYVYQSIEEAICDLLLARALLYVGRIAEGIALLKAIIKCLESSQGPEDLVRQGNPLSLEVALWNYVWGRAHNDLGYAYWMYTGDCDRALEEFDQALLYFKASRLDEERANTLDNRGRAYLEQGRHPEAKVWIELGLALRDEILAILRDWESKTQDEAATHARKRAEYRRALSLISLSKAHLAVGEFEEAERLSTEALQICARLGEKRGSGLAHITLAAAMHRLALTGDRMLGEREGLLLQSTEHLVRALGVFGSRAATGTQAGPSHVSEPIRSLEANRELALVYRDRAALAQQSGADAAYVRELYERAVKHHRAAIEQRGHSNQRLWDSLCEEFTKTCSLFPQFSGEEPPHEPAEQATSDRFTANLEGPAVRLHARSQADGQRYCQPAAAVR